jgi:tellurite resistance protein
MVRRQTGFNAGRIVRRVGGRRILMLGAAALAGGMLTQAAASQRRGGAASGGPTFAPASKGGPSPALPPLPPLPGTVSPRTDRPVAHQELPPIPGAGASPAPGPQADPELPSDLLYVVLRTMIAAALADGELASSERNVIEGRLAESGLSEDRLARLRQDLVFPATPGELAKLLPPGEEPETLLQFAVLIARADGALSEVERRWLETLSAALGMNAGSVAALELEIFAGE